MVLLNKLTQRRRDTETPRALGAALRLCASALKFKQQVVFALIFLVGCREPERTAIFLPEKKSLSVQWKGQIHLESQGLFDGGSAQYKIEARTIAHYQSPLTYRLELDTLRVEDSQGLVLFRYFHDKEDRRHYQLGSHLTSEQRVELYKVLQVDLEESSLLEDHSILQARPTIRLNPIGQIASITLSPPLRSFVLERCFNSPFGPCFLQWLEHPDDTTAWNPSITTQHSPSGMPERIVFSGRRAWERSVMGRLMSSNIALSADLEISVHLKTQDHLTTLKTF